MSIETPILGAKLNKFLCAFSRSMTDLAADGSSTHSPKRKFSFRFPHLAHQSSHDERANSPIGHNSKMYASTKRNFCDEIKNVPDLQVRSYLSLFYYSKFGQCLVVSLILLIFNLFRS